MGNDMLGGVVNIVNEALRAMTIGVNAGGAIVPNAVGSMVRVALRAMAIGVSGVFAVLAVFYGALKLMFFVSKGKEE